MLTAKDSYVECVKQRANHVSLNRRVVSLNRIVSCISGMYAHDDLGPLPL